MQSELMADGFKLSDFSPDDIIDGLPHAPLLHRREKRLIRSRNFWSVGVNNTIPQAESNNSNSNKDGLPPVPEVRCPVYCFM